MIVVNNITKAINKSSILHGINFSAAKSDVVGLLGPNGAGKTTTIRILTGCIEPSSGEVLINEEVISKKNSSLIGYLPEKPPLYPQLKVKDVLKFWAKIKEVSDLKSDAKKDVYDVADICELEEVLEKKCSTLSKGFKQRVGLAVALLGDPQILILDEPTSGLDPVQIKQMRNLILKLKSEGKIIILSSHLMQEISELCTHVVIIAKGKVISNSKISEYENLEASFLEAVQA